MAALRASNPRLSDISPYDAKNLPAEVLLSANENPENLPAALVDEIDERLKSFQFNRYPDPLATRLRRLIAAGCRLDTDCVVLGNGGDEELFNLFLTWGGPGRKVLNIPPTFGIYELNAKITGTEVVEVPRDENLRLREDAICERASQGDIDLVILTSPNNPTGDAAEVPFIKRLLESTDALVLVDEAYGEFSGTTALPLLSDHDNLVILHTFSKAYRLAGVRLGYLLSSPRVIREILKVRQCYSVNSFAQLVGEVVYENREVFRPQLGKIVERRERAYAALRTIPGVTVWPSDSNFLLVRVPNAHGVWQTLVDDYSILVRDFSSARYLEDCLRISIGSEVEMQRFFEAFREILHAPKKQA